MIAALVLATQAAAQPSAAVMAYADCLSTHINGDPRMVEPPAERSARIAIYDDAINACVRERSAVPTAETAMAARIETSTRTVLEDPAAAEQVDGDLPQP